MSDLKKELHDTRRSGAPWSTVERVLEAHEARMKRIVHRALLIGAALGGFLGAVFGYWVGR